MSVTRHYIESARQKPLQARQRLAVAWSAELTALIAMVWILNFQLLQSQKVEVATMQADAPLAAVSESIDDQAGRIGRGWDRLKGMITGN